MMLSCIIRVTQYDQEGPFKREEVSHRAEGKQTWRFCKERDSAGASRGTSLLTQTLVQGQFWTLASRTVRKYIRVVLSHLGLWWFVTGIYCGGNLPLQSEELGSPFLSVTLPWALDRGAVMEVFSLDPILTPYTKNPGENRCDLGLSKAFFDKTSKA